MARINGIEVRSTVGFIAFFTQVPTISTLIVNPSVYTNFFVQKGFERFISSRLGVISARCVGNQYSRIVIDTLLAMLTKPNLPHLGSLINTGFRSSQTPVVVVMKVIFPNRIIGRYRPGPFSALAYLS